MDPYSDIQHSRLTKLFENARKLCEEALALQEHARETVARSKALMRELDKIYFTQLRTPQKER